MTKIVIIIPFSELKPIAEKTFNEHTKYMQENFGDYTEYELEIIVAATTKEAHAARLDGDVLIARGGTYKDLSAENLNVPLVELIVSGTDIVNVLLKCRELYGTLPAAILGTRNMILGTDSLAKQLSVDVKSYLLAENTREDIIENVLRAASEGKKVIIGGNTGNKKARELGLHAMLIPSGRDSFWNAISEAKQVAKISMEERRKALSYQSMLNNAYEGLFALDMQNRITFINAAAIHILQLSPQMEYIGKRCSEVFFSSALNQIIAAPDEYIDEIILYKKTHLSIKKMNLFMHGERVGMVFTLLNASQINDTGNKLREKLYNKGHTARSTFDDIIFSKGSPMKRCIEDARAYAATDSNIMLEGESGTGKEVLSQSIHNLSSRASGNFVAVNCAALPENLLESELFGYVEGAFTGAVKSGKQGLFEIAHNGTIFLDEISEIPLRLQGRLLRVLQEREFMRLGDDRVIHVNIRVIAATNKPLEALVASGKFRRDLYYRLYVLQIMIPPLRDRKNDIPLLAEHFLREFFSHTGKTFPPNDPELYERMKEQPWYGNIRELRNFCERLSVLYTPETTLAALAGRFIKSSAPPIPYKQEMPPQEAKDRPLKRHYTSDKQTEQIDTIRQALAESGGNRTLAAEILGVSRVTLWRLLKKYPEVLD